MRTWSCSIRVWAIAAYRALEDLCTMSGVIRAIGISMLEPDRLSIWQSAHIPAVNQMKTMCSGSSAKRRERMRPNMRSSLNHGRRFEKSKNRLFTHPVKHEIGGSTPGKTTAQVALRSLVQRDIVVIEISAQGTDRRKY